MSQNANSIRVLIVNDDAMACKLWQRVINHEPDMTCVGLAYMGAEAIAQAKRLEPDVVMMDVMMEGMDGFEATRRILEHRPQTAVIVFTAGTRLLDGAKDSGAVDFLYTPITPDDLVQSIRRAYAKKQTGSSA